MRLLQLHTEALFTYDAAGRMVGVNDPDRGPAPRFYLGRCSAGNLWRVRYDVPEATARRLEALATAEPVRDDVRAEPRHLAAMRAALQADGEVWRVYAGPAYRFPDAVPEVRPLQGMHVARITRENVRLLREMNWDEEALTGELAGWEPMLALVEGDLAVSLCFSSRLTARAAEAGVETLERSRGRGYAPIVVAAWAAEIRASGRIPLYSTSWENQASQAVARKLGLVCYASDLSLG